MYTPGNILYFTPFKFKNGATPDTKYFIVLSVAEDDIFLASLPTSKDHIPNGVPKNHGCISIPQMCVNCYYFEANKTVAHKDGIPFAFPLETYVYGEQIEEYDRLKFDMEYSTEGVDYVIKGLIPEDEYKQILICLSKSTGAKNRLLKRVNQQLSKL